MGRSRKFQTMGRSLAPLQALASPADSDREGTILPVLCCNRSVGLAWIHLPQFLSNDGDFFR
jgi:hypothetical protein